MKEYKKWNNILGWAIFIVATSVYLLTLEPTASWWDCGEYIATAFKLQVGHPPGAPTFQLIGRFFSLLALGDTQNVARMINSMSAISSGLTIMFLFWTITMFAKKIVQRTGEISRGKMLAIFGSGIVGAMAYTFSDSFWFSAVEGEVYAMSSLFTAVTFWAILKWDSVADEKHSLRWIIFITFIIGVSIGVHLLSLLSIPAITYIYYFRKYKVTRNGFFLVGILSIVILAIVMYVIIPEIVNLAGIFELFFVNTIGLPFNSGTIIYFILLLGGIFWAHRYTVRKHKPVLNAVILGLIFLLIGYSSFFMLIIRANANTPINENDPQDAISLLSYLNREQYGTYPIFYGPYYNAPVVGYEDGTPVYVKDTKKGKYVITDDKKETEAVYDSRFETIFPRMWSNQKSSHIQYYKEYGHITGKPITVTKPDGSTETRYCPTFGENLRFFFSYQVGFMYLRYFMWNFVGRQNNIESQGEIEDGNWISGINFIDKIRLGDQSDLPISAKNPAHNKFYFLPLLLGLIGFFFQLNSSKRDTWVVTLLFLMTGLAIVIYLNQYPMQPRERDYAYAGSFYAFAIWIGLGVLAIFESLRKYIHNKDAAIAVGVTILTFGLVPGIMGQQGWDDHNRAGKYATRDFAFNYLKGCDKNSVLITYGDNDTFPLWYAQEVEGYHTDVRVLNHMLASGYWYAQQMFNKVYDSDPLPLTLSYDQYENGVNNYIPIIQHPSLEGEYTELKDLINFVASDDPRTMYQIRPDQSINYFPTRKIRLTVDSAKCVENGIVPVELADQIVPYIDWTISQKTLYKNDLLVLDFLATNDWSRALYTANPSSLSGFLDVDQYFHQQGMVYKFMPVKAKNYYKGVGGVDPQKTYDLFIHTDWGNLNDPKVTVDRESYRNTRLPKQNYLRAAQTFLQEGDTIKAVQLMDTCQYYFPDNKITYDMMMMPFAELYYEANATVKANLLTNRLIDIYADDLRYYFSLRPDLSQVYYKQDEQRALYIINHMGQLSRTYGQEDIAKRADEIVNTYSINP